MSRKQAICYLVILGVLTAAVLVLLAIYHVWLMLFAVLLVVTAVGLVMKLRPGVVDVLRRPAKPDIAELFSRQPESRTAQYMPNLILVTDNLSSVRQIVVDKPVFTLGRGAGCDFCMADAWDISRVHATISYDKKTAASYIADNGSQNGTFVNGVKLTPDKPKRIQNGDYVQLGTIRFTAQSAHY